MLNVMEERDIQIRGYVLRLPAGRPGGRLRQPEDYTNRGRIITPLRDRFGAEIRTHYPIELDDEVAVIRQEGHLVAGVPAVILEILARYTGRCAVPGDQPDLRSVRRFAHRRRRNRRRGRPAPGRVRGEDQAVARIIDLDAAVEVLRREDRVRIRRGRPGTGHPGPPVRMATAEAVRAHFHGLDMGALVAALDGHTTVTTGELVTAREFLGQPPVAQRIQPLRRHRRALSARKTTGSAPPPSNWPGGPLPRPADLQGLRRRGDRLG